MKVKFYDYVHEDRDDVDSEVQFYIGQGVPEKYAREIADSNPFYEIRVNCEYDTETGKTEILSASQT